MQEEFKSVWDTGNVAKRAPLLGSRNVLLQLIIFILLTNYEWLQITSGRF